MVVVRMARSASIFTTKKKRNQKKKKVVSFVPGVVNISKRKKNEIPLPLLLSQTKHYISTGPFAYTGGRCSFIGTNPKSGETALKTEE